jgi:cysteinyl-tRNA synthetase
VVDEESEEDKKVVEQLRPQRDYFFRSIEDDLNTPEALASLHATTRTLSRYLESRDEISRTVVVEAESFRSLVDEVLGIFPEDLGHRARLLEGVLDLLLEVRERLRHEKRYDLADTIRSGLASLGISVEDTSRGPRWRLRASRG